MINEIKKNILEFYKSEIEEELEEELICDIWEEYKEKILTKNSILSKINEILFEQNEKFLEGDLKKENFNIYEILLIDKNDINTENLNLEIIDKKKDIIFFDSKFFINYEDEISSSILNILANLLMNKSFLSVLLEEENVENKLFLIILQNNLYDAYEKENLKKSILAYYNIPYKKHIVTTKNYFDNFNDEFKFEKNYQQYDNIINIFHEYLNSNDPLWKFLLLYHIIENFAFRYPIVRQMYRLKDKKLPLYVNNLSLIYKGPKDEASTIKELLIKLIEELNFEDILKLDDNLFEKVNYIKSDIKNKNLSKKQFVELIYKVRNCIVHNKETEWLHIDHNLLKSDEDFLRLFIEYLLPNLEKIIRYYIFNKNDIVDYLDEGPNYILLWGNEPK